jgi:hypothetical protein
VLGLWGEKLLLSLLTFWLVGMLLTASRGKTRILGFVAMAIVVCVDAYVNFGLLLSRHQSVSGNARLEAAVSPAVCMAHLREQEETA